MSTRLGDGTKAIGVAVSIVVFFTVGGFSQTEVKGRVAQWADTLALDERVFVEIERFSADEDKPFSTNYSRDLAADLRRLVFADVLTRLDAIAAGDIEPFVEVTYPEAGFAAKNGTTPGEYGAEPVREYYGRASKQLHLEHQAADQEGLRALDAETEAEGIGILRKLA